MKIGIVEDEAVWREQIRDYIENYCVENTIEHEIILLDGEEVTEALDLDLLFLDIELGEGKSGFAIAERLMNAGNRCRICFLTSHTELARQGYRVNAFRYIDKRCMKEIDEAIDFFLRTRLQDRSISLRDVHGLGIRLQLQSLLLIETSGRRLRYLMLDGREYFCEELISEAAQCLSPFGFYHIQRSYIVNMKYIIEANSREVTLCNGEKVSIGRARGKEFRKAFFEWRMRFED